MELCLEETSEIIKPSWQCGTTIRPCPQVSHPHPLDISRDRDSTTTAPRLCHERFCPDGQPKPPLEQLEVIFCCPLLPGSRSWPGSSLLSGTCGMQPRIICTGHTKVTSLKWTIPPSMHHIVLMVYSGLWSWDFFKIHFYFELFLLCKEASQLSNPILCIQHF